MTSRANVSGEAVGAVAVLVVVAAAADVQPWLQPARPSEFMYGVPDGYSRLLWRYISRDGHWVMVRLRDFKTAGQGLPTSFFVARGCIHLDVYRDRHS